MATADFGELPADQVGIAVTNDLRS